jgi:F-type H+-transporting ATPase subunit alpha
MIPFIGCSIAERLRDRGLDSLICYDDLSKHSRSYRQISLLSNRIPSRDAFPSDVFNVHSTLLERSGFAFANNFRTMHKGSITSFPIIETINSDISEYIATNVISITDGQYFMNSSLFSSYHRPAVDSSLSVTRIGSNAQCKLIKLVSAGIKNEYTNYRIMISSSTNHSSRNIEYARLTCLNHIFFQDHLFISSIETSLILLLVYRYGIISSLIQIHRFNFIVSFDYLYFYYILFISKTSYSLDLYSFLLYFFFICYGVLLDPVNEQLC